ncbi:host cell division inhibitor Icd-like protein [Klebsiella oxytoca]|uniref:host cell division inhibitor Icd-like protein n=1 Tax=Klebsiella oxytoca TaxID=571 RepID=UPI002A0A6EA1|nr:host cell division inhibitor Icd-like protein [Klebsiella oxytoca]
MPSMISCAIRAVTDCDFAFFEPVAMSTFSKIECKTLYTKNYCLEVLTCKTLVLYCVSYTLFGLRCVNGNAPDCSSSTEASNHNVIGANTMACIHHTQTRPKYQYRFLALNRHDKKAKPCRLSVEAATEREARSILAPHFILSLAARLPVQEVRHV